MFKVPGKYRSYLPVEFGSLVVAAAAAAAAAASAAAPTPDDETPSGVERAGFVGH